MRIVHFFLFLSISLLTLAQVDSTSVGEVVDAEIVIEKDREIQLPIVQKINAKITPRNFSETPLNLKYVVNEPDFSWPAYKSDVKFIEDQSEFKQALYQNYLKLGYGNYASPLIELGVFKKIDESSINAVAKHESYARGPVSDDNSASSNTYININSAHKFKGISIKPSVDFQRLGYRFYGNTDRLNTGIVTEDLDRIIFGTNMIGVDINGAGKEVKYYLTPKLISSNQSIVNGRTLNLENQFSISSGLTLTMDDKISVGLDLQGNSASYEGGVTYNRSLFVINPWFSHATTDLRLKGGFLFTTSNNGNAGNSTGFYPVLEAEWKFMPKWYLFGNLDGGVNWNSLHSLINQNQFLADSLLIQNTELSTGFEVGIKGTPINGISIESGYRLESLNQLPFFVPSESDSSQYNLTYDNQSVKIFTYYADVSVAPSANALLGANLNIFGYNLGSLEKAWHMPTYTFSIYYSQTLKEKLTLSAELLMKGGINAPVNAVVNFVKLSPITDLNVGVKYKVTDRGSVFLRINNILNNEYENYIGYPVRGASFKLGGVYRF